MTYNLIIIKKIIVVFVIIGAAFGSTFAMSIKSSTSYQDQPEFTYKDGSTDDNPQDDKCQKYIIGGNVDRKGYSKCYREVINAISISKNEACGKNDGLYHQPLAFNWIFNEDLELQTYNFGFIKLNKKLYFIIKDHILGTDANRNKYLFEYDCITKKSTQIKQFDWSDKVSSVPLRVDATYGIIYILNGGPIKVGYEPYSIMQITLKTKKMVKYQLFDENIEQKNGKKEIIKSNFFWKYSPFLLATDFIEDIGINDCQSILNDMEGGSSTLGIDKCVDFRFLGLIGLSKITKGKGIMTITMPGYTVTTDIDFTKKTIK